MLLSADAKRWDHLYRLLAVLSSVLIALIIGQISAGLAAGLVLGACLVMIGISRFEILIHALIILLPMQSALPVSLKSLGTLNPFNLLAGVIFAVWLVNGVLRKRRLFYWNRMSVVIAVFMLVCVAALANSARLHGFDFMNAQTNALKRWLSPMLLFFPLANTRLTRPAIKRLVITMLIMIFIIAMWMTKDIINVGWEHIDAEIRLGGPFGFGGENDMAAFLVYYPVIAFTIALFESRLIQKMIYGGIFGVSLFPLILSMSRGAYLGISIVIFFVAIARFRWLLPVIAIAAISYQFWVPGAVQHRMESTVITSNETVGGRVPGPHEMERNLEESSALRVRIWRGAFRMIESYPVTGIGYNAFQLAVPQYANMEWGMDAHNMYLRVAAEMGLIALMVFLALFWVPFLSAWSVYRSTKDRFMRGWLLGLMACICGIIIVNIFGSRFVREELVGLYWVSISLMYGYISYRRVRASRIVEGQNRRLEQRRKQALRSPNNVVMP